MSKQSSFVMRIFKGFGQFWWDFLVGDTPELFIAVIAIIGVIALISEVGHFNAWAIAVLPISVLFALRWSIFRAFREARRK
jgi:hypothetical protein